MKNIEKSLLFFQAARHMLGLQQASFAGGPGKRSDPSLLMLRLPYVKVRIENSVSRLRDSPTRLQWMESDNWVRFDNLDLVLL